jgi:hypothetical protein
MELVLWEKVQKLVMVPEIVLVRIKLNRGLVLAVVAFAGVVVDVVLALAKLALCQIRTKNKRRHGMWPLFKKGVASLLL